VDTIEFLGELKLLFNYHAYLVLSYIVILLPNILYSSSSTLTSLY